MGDRGESRKVISVATTKAGRSCVTSGSEVTHQSEPNEIPFASNDAGDYLMLDFAPARGGRPGQVLEWRHESNERRLTAANLEAVLKQLAEGLEGGSMGMAKNLMS